MSVSKMHTTETESPQTDADRSNAALTQTMSVSHDELKRREANVARGNQRLATPLCALLASIVDTLYSFNSLRISGAIKPPAELHEEGSLSEQPMAPSERAMWEKATTDDDRRLNDDEINAKYEKRELRIVTEMNREQLPNFVEALKRKGWMELRPFYQRRPRWDPVRQSRLIESFIMNIPVPPLFVYESDLAKYEVMDGQQRITAFATVDEGLQP